MAQEDGAAALARVEAVRREIGRWRRAKRRRGAGMPERLWGAAVGLAREYGVYRVARTLGVDYGALKERVGRGVGEQGGVEDESCRFVEVALPGLASVERAVSSAEPGWAAVELWRPDGARLVVRLGGAGSVDVVGLAEGFWRSGS